MMQLKLGLLFGFISILLLTAFVADGGDETVGVGIKSDDAYPSRAITILVPYAAGGPSDTLARIIANHMSRTLGQNVLIENVPGAGGTTATLRAKRATPNGYTTSIGNMGTHGAAVSLYPNLGYDPRTDFDPIGLIATAPIVILGRRDFPPKDLKQFVAYLKANDQILDEGHGGVGSIPFDACLLLNHILGVKPRLVPHDGAAPALDSLSRGGIDYMCDQIINAAPRVRAGKVKAYAVAAPERSPALPNVPTTAEGGLPEFELSGWQAMFAPKGTPKDAADKLRDALSKALDDEEVRARMRDLGAELPRPDQRTPQALAALVRSEVEHWADIIRAARNGH